MYRYERQLKYVEKAERMAREAGFIPNAVSRKILVPLLEGVSYEEDESLHDMWAALLTSASSPDHAQKVRRGFIAILKQMALDEARLLKRIYDEQLCTPNQKDEPIGRQYLVFSREYLDEISAELQWDEAQLEICLERLQSQNWLQIGHSGKDGEELSPNHIGSKFLSACQPPKAKV